MTRLEMIAATLDGELTNDELRDLVIAIDARVGAWSFTIALADHFDGLRQVFQIEKGLDASKATDGQTIGQALMRGIS